MRAIYPQNIGRHLFLLCLLFVLAMPRLFAQVQPDSTTIPARLQMPDDSTQITADPQDPVFGGNQPQDASSSSNRKSEVQDAVEFQSTDSLIVDFRSGRSATLYGAAKVSHSAGILTSGEIRMDLDINVVEATAKSMEDTLSMPLLKRETDEIRSQRILFNYKTGKGKFEEARINVGEGQLIGSKIKNVSDTEIFIEDGRYSTCPPEYLYYYIKAEKMKVVDQDEIFFTNAQLYILDIPYPLVFPFGYVPTGGLEQKKSGLLTPSYIFDAKSTKGLGLSNVGWFQYVNDYYTTSLSTDLYTSGTFYLNSTNQYRKGDVFNGSVALGYSRLQGLEPTDPGYTRTVNKRIGINHSQKISPYASLTANIDLRTQDFFQQNSLNIDELAQTTSNSRAAFKYNHPEGLFNFSTSSNMVQNFGTNTTTLRLPDATFSLKQITPFQSRSGNTPKWYESISLKYNNKARSEFIYKPIDADSAEITFLEALTDRDLYEEATGNDDYIRAGLQQSASISVGKILNSQFINTSAGVNVNEYWYPTSIRKTFNEETNTIDTERISGLTTGRDFSTSLSFSTTLYGISQMKIGNVEGFRHTLSPNMSFSYRPDFSEEQWGFYRSVQSDTLGNTQRYSIFEDELFNGPGSGESRSISFGLRNMFETKIVKRDSTGEINERAIKIIDDLSMNASYNFARDSLKLSNMSFRISSRAIEGLNLNANSSISFYKRDANDRQYNEFVWKDGRIAYLQSFDVSASTTFRGGSGGPEPFTPIYRRVYDPLNQGIFSTIDPGYGYEPVDPLNSPWSFSLKFSYRWQFLANKSPSRRATLNADNISFNLTPKWRFRTRLGYDFIEKELTPSEFRLDRNLECWTLSFQISPFGNRQYYFFRLSLNSQQIQTLFQKLPILRNLERQSEGVGTTRSPWNR